MTPPTLAPLDHLVRDASLRAAATRLNDAYFDVCHLAFASIEAGDHQRFGFPDPIEYLVDRLGVRYRTLRRWLAVFGAWRRLPAAEQPAARETLARLGSHKASVLAPLVGRNGTDWRAVAEKAETMTEPALQEYVTSITGLSRARAGNAADLGERALRSFLAHLPEPRREWAEAALRKTASLGETSNMIAAMLFMVECLARDLADAGHPIPYVEEPWKPDAETDPASA